MSSYVLFHCITAQQHEIDTDEAVQRAALAMVPNPIYSGNPIYDEIADIKFLRSTYLESQSKDEGYVEISNHATNVTFGDNQEVESKSIRDKCRPLPVSTISPQIAEMHGAMNTSTQDLASY